MNAVAERRTRRRFTIYRLLILSGLLIAATVSAQGHSIEDNQLLVREGDWTGWNVPLSTVEFSDAGIQPRRIRERLNAVTNAGSFVNENDEPGGIRSAGSNEADAANLIDGSEETFWEPDTSMPVSSWWVEIDLGRVVWADKIVLKFVDAQIGDPFLQFNVLTSNGLAAFSQSKTLKYITASRSDGLNKSQRLFEIDVEPSQETAGLFDGDVFQFVQILVTASDLGRGQLISESSWNNLGEEDRGDVVHFLKESSGVIREIDREQYEILDPARQGPIEHYRHERPRLAEVEVWTHGDNISLGSLDRGGEIGGTTDQGTEGFAIDGDYRTVWNEQVGVSGGTTVDVPFDRELVLDLGSWFWISRMAFSFDRENIAHGFTGAFPNYVLGLSEGQRNPDGSLAYVTLADRVTNDKAFGRFGGLFPLVFYEQNEFPLTRARYFKMDYRVLELPSNWANSGIRELQFYGRGYLPQVTFDSPLIELGANPRILSDISWTADTPSGTDVQFRTRTGDELKRFVRYFRKSGLEVESRAAYDKLLSFQKGDSLVAFIAAEDWSQWSQFYAESGAAITSPSPRRYVQLQASIISDDPDKFALLRNLTVSLDQPLAGEIIGEIGPRNITSRGDSETFTLYLRPSFPGSSRGFDQLMVQLPPGTEVDLVDVQVGTEAELEAGTAVRYGLDELQKMSSGADSLWVQLPAAVDANQQLVAMRFSGILYLASNAFRASVAAGEGEELIWQRVDAGEATDLSDGSGMTVFTPFGGEVLGDVEVLANPFTPNGDGVNDEVVMVFPVFKIQGSKSLILEVYGLDGRLVRRVERATEFAAGEQRIAWDGRNAGGNLAPPGIYICRVGLDVDARGDEPMVAKLVSSAY